MMTIESVVNKFYVGKNKRERQEIMNIVCLVLTYIKMTEIIDKEQAVEKFGVTSINITRLKKVWG